MSWNVDLPIINFGSDQAPVFCAPSIFTAAETGANPQTGIAVGLIGETTSLGNINATTSFTSDKTFALGTKNVHIEIKIEKWGGGIDAQCGLFFADITVPASPVLVGGIIILSSLDVYFDPIAGMPLPFAAPTVDATLRIALYLDGNTDLLLFKDNKGNQYAPDVNPLWNSANLVSMGTQVGAGSDIGNEADILHNFGSSSFAIEPQANKWCD